MNQTLGGGVTKSKQKRPTDIRLMENTNTRLTGHGQGHGKQDKQARLNKKQETGTIGGPNTEI